MSTDLTLKEKLFILALTKKGSIESSFVGFGLAGAGLLELVQSGKADEQGKNLILKSSKHTHDAFLDFMIDIIYQSRKTRAIRFWVSKFGHKNGRLKQFMKNSLLDKKVIWKVEKRFLFFTYYRYPLKDETIRNNLKKILKEYIHGKGEGEVELLFLLCSAIQFYNKIFDNKEDRKRACAKFKELKKKDFVVKGVSDAVQAVQAAILASTIAVSAVATTAASAGR